MAYFPNFVFSDPALQKTVSDEAIAEAQLRAAQERNRSEALDRISREREVRATRQAEIDRAERAQLQQDRQFQQGLAQRQAESQLNADLYRQSQKDYQTTADQKAALAAETERYNALQRILQDTSDPMTPLEFEAQSHGLSPERKQLLRSLLDSTRNKALNAYSQAQNAKTYWDAQLTNLDPKKGDTVESKLKLFNASPAKNLLSYDPSSGTFTLLYRKPREDVPFGPQPEPAAAAGAVKTFSPDQFRAALAGAGPPTESMFSRAFGAPIRDFATSAIGGLMNSIARPSVTNLPPAGPVNLPAPAPATPNVPGQGQGLFDYEAIQRALQRIGIIPRPPTPPPPPLTPAQQGILAPLDYSGPEYDYSGATNR